MLSLSNSDMASCSVVPAGGSKAYFDFVKRMLIYFCAHYNVNFIFFFSQERSLKELRARGCCLGGLWPGANGALVSSVRQKISPGEALSYRDGVIEKLCSGCKGIEDPRSVIRAVNLAL